MTKMNISELEIELGVSRQTLHKYKRLGVIVSDEHGKFDPDEVQTAILEYKNGAGAEQETETSAYWKARREKANALLAELELEKEQEKLIEYDSVKALVGEAVTELKASVAELPASLSRALLSCQDAEEAEKLIESELNRVVGKFRSALNDLRH